MRWYINDVSLQGQFTETTQFLSLLEELLSSRGRFIALKNQMYLTSSIGNRMVVPGQTLRHTLSTTNRTELRRAVLNWLDRKGPFIEDDRQPEADDFFECKGKDVTDSGLGEAARRVKSQSSVVTFSFSGGEPDFGERQLPVDHGIPDDRLGLYIIDNLWEVAGLEHSAASIRPAPANWEQLVQTAREKYPNLCIPDAIYNNPALSKEPFEAVISDRAIALLKYLNDYMEGRSEGGVESAASREVIDNFFTGDRALFSGESQTNQTKFEAQLTFPDPEDTSKTIFAHWHGKISHRYFRLHFEWPAPKESDKLKILYFGPKLTKN